MAFWQTIKDYQSIVGAILSAVISVLVALFVTRRVNEGGRINFLYNYISAKLRISAAPPVRTNSFEKATDGDLTISYDLYNNSGIRKVMRSFSFAFKMGRKLEYLPAATDKTTVHFGPRRIGQVGPMAGVDLGQKVVSSITLDPREYQTLTIQCMISQWSLDLLNRDAALVFIYKDQNDKEDSFTFPRIKNNKQIQYEM